MFRRMADVPKQPKRQRHRVRGMVVTEDLPVHTTCKGVQPRKIAAPFDLSWRCGYGDPAAITNAIGGGLSSKYASI
jgi:hypothetical protein